MCPDFQIAPTRSAGLARFNYKTIKDEDKNLISTRNRSDKENHTTIPHKNHRHDHYFDQGDQSVDTTIISILAARLVAALITKNEVDSSDHATCSATVKSLWSGTVTSAEAVPLGLSRRRNDGLLLVGTQGRF